MFGSKLSIILIVVLGLVHYAICVVSLGDCINLASTSKITDKKKL